MNDLQKRLLNLIVPNGFGRVTLSEIGAKIGITNRQKVKYHLDKLEEAGYITVTRNEGQIEKVVPTISSDNIISIPVYGAVNCGSARLMAEENFQGYLKVSKKLLQNRFKTNLFALRAVGDSMNDAKINGQIPIVDGDYVIVDPDEKSPKNTDYVVSVIDGAANVKKFIKEENRIKLQSESLDSNSYPPIFIHPEDDYVINGVVVDVIKK